MKSLTAGMELLGATGMELLGATPTEKTSSMVITKIVRSLWRKPENVLGTGCQRTSCKSLSRNSLLQLDVSESAITLQRSRTNQTQGGTARLG